MEQEHAEQPQGAQARKLVPLTEWPSRFGWPPLGGLRSMVHNAEKNGFHRVIRRVGTRVLLDVDEWNAWVDTQDAEASAKLKRPTAR